MTKRFVSFLMAVLMVVTILPVQVFAASLEKPTSISSSSAVYVSIYMGGTTFPSEPGSATDARDYVNFGRKEAGVEIVKEQGGWTSKQYIANGADTVVSSAVLDMLSPVYKSTFWGSPEISTWGYANTGRGGVSDYIIDSRIRGNDAEIIAMVSPESTPVEDYEIIWYVVKLESDGWHIDGLITEKAKYSISYDANGATSGTLPNGETGITAGSIRYAGEPSNLRKSYGSAYQVFQNWNTARDGSGTPYEVGAEITVNADTVLYAQWAPPAIPFTITINCVNSETGEEIQTEDRGSEYNQIATITPPEIPGYIAESEAVTRRFNENNNVINFYYTIKTDLSYTVNYLEEGTGKVLADAKTVSEQTYGNSVTETAEVITGYTADENSKSITIGEDENVINFYYTAKTVPYTVKYVNAANTSEEMFPAEKFEGKFDSTVTASAKTKTGYTVDAPSKNLTLKSETGNEIVFYYSIKNNLSYTVNHIDEYAGKVIKTETFEKQVFGTEVTANAESFYGYGEGTPAFETITIGEGENVINFYYTAKTVPYTVKHLHAETQEKLVEDETDVGRFNATVTVMSRHIPGYTADEFSKPIIITSEEENVVIFYYTPNDVSYTVKYLNADDPEEEIYKSKTVTGKFGTEVTENHIPKTGYTVDVSSRTFTLGETNADVIFYYSIMDDLSYNVHYYKDGTSESLYQSKKVTGKTFGDKVTENAVSIDGYNLVGASSVNFTVGETNADVIFYYAPRTDLSYTVKYLERGTQKVLESEKTVSGITFGTKVTENAVDIRGYEKVDPTTSKITVGTGENEIVFYYTPVKDLSYTVNYLEKDTEKVLKPAKTVGGKTFKSNATEIAPVIEGYNVDSDKEKNIVIDLENNVINFYYTIKTDLSYTVNYLEKGTENVLAPAKTVENQTFGTVVEEESIPLTGYNADAAKKSITVADGENVINFYYTPKEVSYTVKYLHAETHEEIFPSKTIKGKYGDNVTENYIPSFGYNVNETFRTFTLGETNEDVIFYYAPRTDLSCTVLYIEQDTGRLLVPPKNIENQTFGAEVTENAIEIEGYNKVAPTSSTITIGLFGNVIRFYYTPKEVSYTVKFVNAETSKEMFESKTFSGEYGTEAIGTAEVIPGYTVDKNSKSIVLKTEGNEIVFYYSVRKDIDYTVKYVRESDGSELAAGKTVEDNTFGTKVTEKALDIEGYTVDAAEKEITLAESGNEIIFEYSKRTDLSYTVNYLEKGTDKVLATAKVVDGQTFKSEVTESAIDIEGYDKVAPTDATITIGVKDNVINFYYTKRVDLSYTVNYLEKDTDKVLATAKVVDGQTFKSEVTESAIEIEGYDKVAPTDATITIEVEDNVINFYYTKRVDLSYTVNYLEKDTDKVLVTAKTVDGQTFKSEVTESAIEIEGYDKVAPTDATITIKVKDNVINFYYTKRVDLSYTVNYLEKDTDKVLATAKVVDGQTFKSEVTESAIDIEGYDKVAPTDATITIKVKDNVINFYYTKRVDLSYTVNYLEKDTNKVLATAKVVDGQTFEAEVTESAIEIEDYTLVSDASVTITIGAGTNEINFYYEKDLNDDGKADRYQKKVTFRVINGYWGSISSTAIPAAANDEDIVIYLDLLDEKGEPSENGSASLKEHIPTGMIPKSGYRNGRWDTTPPETVSGIAPAVYTYRFEEIPTIKVVIDLTNIDRSEENNPSTGAPVI